MRGGKGEAKEMGRGMGIGQIEEKGRIERKKEGNKFTRGGERRGRRETRKRKRMKRCEKEYERGDDRERVRRSV